MLDILQNQSVDLSYLRLNGEVLSDNFITGSALAAEVGLTAGTLINNNTSWLSIEYYGRRMMIPKLSLRRNIQWRHLYQSGLVYGTDDDGLTPSGNPRNQLTVVEINGIKYKVYLLSGTDGDIDPSATISGSAVAYNLSGFRYGEVQKIFYPLITDSLQNVYKGPKIADYKQKDLGFGGGGANGFSIWTRSTYGPNSAERIYIRNPDISSYFHQSATYTDTSFGWKPVLEEI